MVITKFEDDDDWGDSTNVDYFNDGKTLTNLNCKADAELPILKSREQDQKHTKDLSNPKQNNHAQKKSLKRIEKFRKMQNDKTIEMKKSAERNKYSNNKKPLIENETISENQDKITKVSAKKRKLETLDIKEAPIKKLKLNNESLANVKLSEDNQNAKVLVSKKKKKKKPHNNKFKPKDSQLIEDKESTSLKADNVHMISKEKKMKDKLSEVHTLDSNIKQITSVMVLDDECLDEEMAKLKERKLKNKIKKLKRKEESAKERDSKIVRGEFLERVPLNDFCEEENDKECKINEFTVGDNKLNVKRLKKLVEKSDVKIVEEKIKTKKMKDIKKLTLKERMEERLDSAHFRHLNEQLYTQTGDESLEMFCQEPEKYEAYHRGYSAQVCEWPLNPVDKAIEFIRKKNKDCIIADLGCGDAKIAASVGNVVYSYDLVAANARVQACNMSKVPLLSKNVDIAVFCLSLMGTDFISFLIEANRILKPGGTLVIAEVVSRFEDINKFARQLERLGFTLKKTVSFNLLQTLDDKNKMFIWFEFLKVKDTPAGKTPNIVLNPCKYKKR